MAKTRTREETEDPKRPAPVARDGTYVLMLAVTLIAIIVGCVMLYLDNDEYGGKSPPATPKVEIKQLGAKAESTTPGGPGAPDVTNP